MEMAEYNITVSLAFTKSAMHAFLGLVFDRGTVVLSVT